MSDEAPARSCDGWSFQFVREWSVIDSQPFLERWQSAVAQAIEAGAEVSIYQHPGFVLSWLRTMKTLENIEPLLGFSADGRGNQLFLPWVIVREQGRVFTRRVLEHVGLFMSGYTDPLVFAGDETHIDWEGFWNSAHFATAHWCDLSRFRFVRTKRAGVRGAVEHKESTPVLNLERFGNFSRWHASCSGEYRYDIRRKLRRLESQDEVRLRIYAPSEGESVRHDVVENFLPHHSRISFAKDYSDPFLEPRMTEWLFDLCKVGVPEGWCVYSTLSVGDNPVAWVVGFLLDRNFYFWRPTYALEWKAFSPGKVLLFMLIEHAFSADWRAIHFHTGDQSYKFAVRPDFLSIKSITRPSPGIRGTLLGFYDRVCANVAVRFPGLLRSKLEERHGSYGAPSDGSSEEES